MVVVILMLATTGTSIADTTQHQTEHCAEHHETVAAIADEWQREALGWQDAGIYAEADQKLNANQQRKEVSGVAGKVIAGSEVMRLSRSSSVTSATSAPATTMAPTLPNSSAITA